MSAEGSGERLSASTDPRWDPARGGLRSDTCAAGVPGVAQTTIDPPAPPEDPAEARHRETMDALGKIADGIAASLDMLRAINRKLGE